jgi:hypothetical protein
MKDDFRTDGLLDQFISILAPEWRVTAQEGICDDPLDINKDNEERNTPMTTSRQVYYDRSEEGFRGRRSHRIRPWKSKPDLSTVTLWRFQSRQE